MTVKEAAVCALGHIGQIATRGAPALHRGGGGDSADAPDWCAVAQFGPAVSTYIFRPSSADALRPHLQPRTESTMNMTLSLAPIVSLIAGILILIVPRMLNYIVAVYLIVIGLLGLFGTGNFHLK